MTNGYVIIGSFTYESQKRLQLRFVPNKAIVFLIYLSTEFWTLRDII